MKKVIINLLLLINGFAFSASAQSTVIYGTCRYGGIVDSSIDDIPFYGTIFKYSPAKDTLIRVFEFDSINGYWPCGRFMQASDGNLYGLTEYGGNQDGGVLFQFDPVSLVYTLKWNFNTGAGGSKGGLVQYGSNLYGLISDTLYNVLYSYDILADTFKLEYTFPDGINPHGDLTLFNNKLYGVTLDGGIYRYGVIFRYEPSNGNYDTVFNFDNTVYGSLPTGKLTAANNGKIYGLTSAGGANGTGTILEYDPNSGQVNKKFDFEALGTSSFSIGGSAGPTGSLLLAQNGNLYGFVDYDLDNATGAIFEYAPGASFILTKYVFESDSTNQPGANLIQASNGLLYCANSTIYSYDYTTNTYATLAPFRSNIGDNPFDGLIEVNLTTGIEDVKTNGSLNIFPTPTTDKIFVTTPLNNQGVTTAYISDMIGRNLINQFDILEGKIAFDVHSLMPGMYLVQVKQGNDIYTGKFVKMN